MASPAPNKCSSCTISCLANKSADLSRSEVNSVLWGFSEAYKLLLTQKEAALTATDGPPLESALGTLLNKLVSISLFLSCCPCWFCFCRELLSFICQKWRPTLLATGISPPFLTSFLGPLTSSTSPTLNTSLLFASPLSPLVLRWMPLPPWPKSSRTMLPSYPVRRILRSLWRTRSL